MFDINTYWSVHCGVNVLLCILSSFVVGLSGVVPLLFISRDKYTKRNGQTLSLKRWLSYATGSLLGEVFIHILPESWTQQKGAQQIQISGTWLLLGLLFFFFIERLAVCQSSDHHIHGYLNLFANVIDNFTHGAAIAGSYLVSLRLGFLTTLCILVHEIPHEMADFAVLLRSGFTKREAAKAQFATALASTLGAVLTISTDAFLSSFSTRWILPFTAGGFLYIALVSLLPDLLKELSVKESCVHLSLILFGILSMGFVSFTLDFN